MSLFLALTVLLCVTSVLTSNDTETPKTNNSELNSLFERTVAPDNVSPQPALPTTGSIVKDVPPAELGNTSPGEIVSEGGPVRIVPSTPLQILNSEEHEPVVPRKGVHLSSEDEAPMGDADPPQSNQTETESTPGSLSTTQHSLDENVSSTNQQIDKSLEMQSGNGNTSNTLPTVGSGPRPSPTKPSTTKKHIPKPTVTTSENDDDKPIPASPTQRHPIGMPRKIDYIVPVAITVMAVPLLGVAAFVLYTRGKDCWEKRHYKRMDFLIDGMYND